MKTWAVAAALAALAWGTHARAQTITQINPLMLPCVAGTACNLGVGSLTVNGAELQASTPFRAPNLTIQLQALFLGTGAGASYPSFTSDSGYGPIGIGARALNALNVAGQEDTCVGTVACANYTGTLTSAFGMDALGQEVSQPGDTAIGDDAMRDAISTGGYDTALGQGALAHGYPGAADVLVGVQAGTGNSSAVSFTGTVTVGDVEQLVLSSTVGGITGLPLTVSHTNASGDTLATIATALAASIQNAIVNNGDATLSASEGSLPNGEIFITMHFPGSGTNGWKLAIAPTVTGAGTEVVTAITGSNFINTTAVGMYALQGLAAGSLNANTAVGQASFQSDTTGQYNTGVGFYSGQQNMTGQFNVAVGYQALMNNITGSSNAVVGANASQNENAPNTVAVGYASGNLHTNGYSTFVGADAGDHATSGVGLTDVGYLAGSAETTAQKSTIIGSNVGQTTFATGTGVLLLGSGNVTVDTPLSSTSNYINIENIFTVTGTNTPSTSVTTIAGELVLPAPGSGTAASYACFTSGGQLISSATAC